LKYFRRKSTSFEIFFFKTTSNEKLTGAFTILYLIYRRAAVLAVEKEGVSVVKSGL